MSLRIFLIDDDAQLRQAIQGVLTGDSFHVCGEAGSGSEALTQLSELTDDARPDIILCDVEMPGQRGDELVPELRTFLPDALIVMLTSVRDRDLVMNCVKSGVSDFILKTEAVAEILPGRLQRLWQRKRGATAVDDQAVQSDVAAES